MPYKSFEFIVSGRVQGVGYRVFAKKVAAKEGIVGYVKNDTKGDVVGVAQGADVDLRTFRRFLSQGPRHALVENVEVLDERELDELEYSSFEIRRT